jgi:hypothetical protein
MDLANAAEISEDGCMIQAKFSSTIMLNSNHGAMTVWATPLEMLPSQSASQMPIPAIVLDHTYQYSSFATYQHFYYV